MYDSMALWDALWQNDNLNNIMETLAVVDVALHGREHMQTGTLTDQSAARDMGHEYTGRSAPRTSTAYAVIDDQPTIRDYVN